MNANWKPVVYISHPITENPHGWGAKACAVWDTLFHSDEVVPICPAWSLYQECNGPSKLQWKDYLTYDFELIKSAVDAIVVMPGGESKGRDAEVEYAQSIGLPVFIYPEGLPALYEWAEAKREDYNGLD